MVPLERGEHQLHESMTSFGHRPSGRTIPHGEWESRETYFVPEGVFFENSVFATYGPDA